MFNTNVKPIKLTNDDYRAAFKGVVWTATFSSILMDHRQAFNVLKEATRSCEVILSDLKELFVSISAFQKRMKTHNDNLVGAVGVAAAGIQMGGVYCLNNMDEVWTVDLQAERTQSQQMFLPDGLFHRCEAGSWRRFLLKFN
ncbi:hypothetical protein CHARACLAT_032016 [Characodon lateralis]|uniref:Uncharacterized protein n=1 Tax=Characodon lateralis TaxID=208331 RepID=A0ABU7DLK6_9TELE|nr:hypothetical protein [Characodon lateralis]